MTGRLTARLEEPGGATREEASLEYLAMEVEEQEEQEEGVELELGEWQDPATEVSLTRELVLEEGTSQR